MSLLLSVLLRVHRTSNNAYGNKWVQYSYFNHTAWVGYYHMAMGSLAGIHTVDVFTKSLCESISGTTSCIRYCNSHMLCLNLQYGFIWLYKYNQFGFVVTESDQKLADGRPLTFTFFTQNCLHYFLCCAILVFLNLYLQCLSYTCWQFTNLYAFNAVWGRFDQTLGNINTLYSMQGESDDVQLFLVTEDSIIFLLKPVSSADTLIGYLVTSFAIKVLFDSWVWIGSIFAD